ncbi:MAG: hypothetical protein RL135_1624, partial [Bacteroidota bacterium]
MTNKEFDIIFNQKLHQHTASVPNGLWDKIALQDLSGPKDDFDEFIHQKLYHHTAAVPADFWERVKPVAEEKRRRFLFWLPKKYMAAASILLLLLAGTTAAYIFLNGNPVILEDTETVQLPLPNSSNTKQLNQPIDSIYEKTEAPVVVENSSPKMGIPSDKKT